MSFNTKFLILTFVLLTCVSGVFAEGLHPFYEQNGDAFLMIGEGNRAVWALNNLTSGIPEALYDPYDAYGLTAAQAWNAETESSDKDLFTFSGEEDDTDLTSLEGILVPRRMITTATRDEYGFGEVPPSTVHRFHSWPDSSPTGLGNHSQWLIDIMFDGICYPCNTIPDEVATMPGYYWYPVGTGYYHDADAVVWSNWTYSNTARSDDARRSTTNPPPVNQRHDPGGWGEHTPPRGPWMVCCSGLAPGNGWGRGGWVRRVRRENLWGSYRDMKLFEYRIDSGATAPTLRSNVASVLASISGTYDLNGECCDGCIRAVNGVAMPGVPSPHLATAYSSVVDRSYLYRRDFGSTSYTMQGTTEADTIVGDGGDITCKFLGVSSKSEDGNYVYLLGLNQINQWLNDANATEAMLLDELTDVAVSDQWWQTGGIVYAYDRTKGMVYRFVRNEGGANGIPAEINVSAGGVLPDKIGADGFGNLYIMRTEYEPADTDEFVPGTESDTYFAFDTPAGPVYSAEFEQFVYKSVFKRDYYTGSTEQIPGRILIGTNTFSRNFTASDTSDYSTWSWAMDGYDQLGDIVDDNIRTELAVINSPTPPRPGNLDALTDILGPMIAGDTGFDFAEPDDEGYLTDEDDYWFMVENAPYFDVNNVNVGNWGNDVNENGRIGQFPNTVQRSSLRYYWKVIQTHDRFGEELSEPAMVLDMEDEGVSGDYLFLFPPAAGEFEVGVKVTYRYYDYRDLPVGAMSSQKGDVLKPPLTEPPLVAEGEDDNGYSWATIKIETVPPVDLPEDSGVLMTGILGSGDEMESNFKPGPALLGYGCDNAAWGNAVCGHIHCDPNEETLPPTKFIFDGYSLVPQVPEFDEEWSVSYPEDAATWAIKLRDSNRNLRNGIDRVASMTSDVAPMPDDPGYIENTIEWAGGLNVTWTSTLNRGEESIIDRQIITSEPTLSLSQLRRLFPVPSEPASYTLTVDFRRTYRYEIYQAVWQVIGGELVREHLPVPRVVNMRIWSEAEVLVTDNTPPGLHLNDPLGAANSVSKAFFMSDDFMYGTTGESLADADSPPLSNPSSIVIVVADNNPMANSTFTNVGTDLYHSNVEGVGSRLRVSFTPNNQAATFSYTIHGGEMPPVGLAADDELNKWYSTGETDEYKLIGGFVVDEDDFDDLTQTTGLYNRTFSYRVYTIDVSDLAHFSRELAKDSLGAWDYTGDWTDLMHPARATNSPGYRNLTYGLSWQEACHSDTNQLVIGPQREGQIVVRDNDRPNVFITARQDKYPTTIFRSPTNLQEQTVAPVWINYTTSGMSDHERAGSADWTSSFMDAYFDSGYREVAAETVSNSLFTSSMPLEVDVPVTFGVITSDNAGSVATISYSLYDSSDNQLIDGSFSGNLPMQYVFRQPGDYKIVVEVEDDALSWPSNPNAYAPWASAGDDPEDTSSTNTRKLEVEFSVVPTRLDIRTIERQRDRR